MPPSASLQRTNTRRRTMKPRTRFFALLFFGTLFQACRLDMESAGPNAHRSVAADVMSDGPEWAPWSTPINLGPVVNSSADDYRPSPSHGCLRRPFNYSYSPAFGGHD